VSDLYIPTIILPILLEEICRPILGIYKSLTDTECGIGAEAALFPEKEYISWIFVAVFFLLAVEFFPGRTCLLLSMVPCPGLCEEFQMAEHILLEEPNENVPVL
jgi:hypothetical protein